MEKSSRRDLSRFFDAWVFGASVPQAKFSYRVEGSKAIFRIEQPGLPMEFPVSVTLSYHSGEQQTLVMIADDKVTEQTFDLPQRLRSARANEDHGALVNLR
jgi:aminopeptidase N